VILVTRSGTCGIATVFENFDIPVLAGAFLIRMVLSNQLDPYFLRDYLNSSIGQIRVAAIASGAFQKNISGTSLKNFYIPVPSKAEQFKIAGLIGGVSKKIMTETLKRDALDSLFQSMLHHLMVGKTRV